MYIFIIKHLHLLSKTQKLKPWYWVFRTLLLITIISYLNYFSIYIFYFYFISAYKTSYFLLPWRLDLLLGFGMCSASHIRKQRADEGSSPAFKNACTPLASRNLCQGKIMAMTMMICFMMLIIHAFVIKAHLDYEIIWAITLAITMCNPRGPR